jgi:membrane protease YdiL (CAAX protease family)
VLAWAPWTSIAALFAGLVVTVLGSTIIAVISGTASDLDDPPPGISLGLTLFQDIALVGAAIGFYVLSALWVAILNLHETQELPDRLGADKSTLNLVAVVILITVVAPLCEELFFRGYFFGSLRNWRGVWPAALLTGVIFGLIHVGSAPAGFLVPLGFFGVGLCLLYHYSGSLYPCIALHALNNSIALGATLHWGWEIPVTMVGSVIGALTIAMLLARTLGGDRALPAATPAPAG